MLNLSTEPIKRFQSFAVAIVSAHACPQRILQLQTQDSRVSGPLTVRLKERVDNINGRAPRAPRRAPRHEAVPGAFDPVKMRNKGTEAEKYVARGLHLKEVKTKKKDWRKQHEDFIATVRAAKGVKGYEAPPLDTSDYIECPHCGRKFNQTAGDRHIPKCAEIKHNKPAAGKRR
ncbi:hypothetical protein HAZT_HAZT008609 [Hyalella azteca]|uniref:C2HC/C3H-type domain-containing protein n=1 Tax=Hyalella azteca TaxID=294128 RepID=A0A6A0H7G7_HYAAZ|nr:hypothetical protein HAZT_HAZT008609 [Hyalella azteca]